MVRREMARRRGRVSVMPPPSEGQVADAPDEQ
jgi:hypothetical protein